MQKEINLIDGEKRTFLDGYNRRARNGVASTAIIFLQLRLMKKRTLLRRFFFFTIFHTNIGSYCSQYSFLVAHIRVYIFAWMYIL